MTFADFVRAPNIANDPSLYERENRAIDPSGSLWAALRRTADWTGRTTVRANPGRTSITCGYVLFSVTK